MAWDSAHTTPGVSESMVLKAELARKADLLACAVEEYFDGSQTTKKAEEMRHALFSYQVTRAAIYTGGYFNGHS